MHIESKEYKIVHLMSNDKFAQSFVTFLNRNFDTKEHLVLCKRFFKEFEFPEGENVKEIISCKDFDLANPQIEKIICHSLFDEERVQYLYHNKEILKEKAYWQIWGGDLYNCPRDEVNDYVRTHFKGYITSVDKEYAIQKYNMQGAFFYAHYTSPFFGLNIKKIKEEREPHKGIHIQINNSADESTLEMLDILKKFRAKDITICTVLSYGQKQFNNAILEKGKGIFGSKFYAISKYLAPEEYAKHLANQDILILNQNRQQAGANIHVSIIFGTKLYIHKDNPRRKDLEEHKLCIYGVENIADMNFEEFIEYTMQEENRLRYSEQYKMASTVVEQWQAIFNA